MVMDSITPTRIQQNMKTGLNRVATHAAVMVLVLLDILIITVLLIIDICLPEDSRLTDQCANGTAAHGNRYDRMRQTQLVISITQLTVLSGFMLEIVIRILANIPSIIHDRWQVFDCLVVFVVFVLYVCLTVSVQMQTAAYSAAYIISLRLWRIGRIYCVIQQKAAKHAENMMQIHVRTSTIYEEQLKKAQQKIIVQKRQMERLEQAVLCLKSLAYSNITLSANRTRSLPAFTQGHTDLSNIAAQEQSLTAAPEFSIQSENLMHMSESASELVASTSFTQHLCSLDVPDILDNMKQATESQDNSAGGNHLTAGCLRRLANRNIAPCLNLKKISQGDVNSCSSPHTVADLNKKTSIGNFDPEIQAMESYLQSLLNSGVNSSYFNEAYAGEEEHNHCPSTNVLTKMQHRSDYVPTASTMPNVLSQMCTEDDVHAIERINHDPFPFDNTRSYLSQNGIPMTDL